MRIAHAVYLHGFASSPASSKAGRFGRELEARGVGFSCPDLNQPAFETLTVTRMLEQARAAIVAAPRGPVALIGSSHGAFVALHAAGRRVAYRFMADEQGGGNSGITDAEFFTTDEIDGSTLVLIAVATKPIV